jgi:hypothetical protein
MRTRAGLKSVTAPTPHSVKDLLSGRLAHLTRVTDPAAAPQRWEAWLSAHLPVPLPAKICAVHEREGTLTVFAESAAWCARLRFALSELEDSLRRAHPSVTSIAVRVLPRS